MERLPEILGEAAQSAGCPLSPTQSSSLVLHLTLLEVWNRNLNLVGPGTLETWARRHTADSLAVSRWVREGHRVVDVGSGAGFPGVPLAVVHPAAEFLALEPRQNRAAFLQNIIARLQLRNLKVVVGRASTQSGPFDLVLGRAVAPPEAFAAMALRLCGNEGRFAVFLQGSAPSELSGSRLVDSFTYSIEGQSTRTVALYVPRGTSGVS